MESTYLTKEGLEKLEEEQRVLKKKIIPDIAARIDDARQLGDLSENAEYHGAKEEMAWAQTRLAQIEAITRNAQIIEKTSQSNTVAVGSSIVVEWDNREKTFTIVGPTEADPKQGKISNESPLGHAFLGKRTGETVEVEAPGGIRSYHIKHIS